MQIQKTNEIDNGINMLIYGPAGIGKTHICSTAPTPLIISIESGLLTLKNFNIPAIEIKNIDDLREAYNFIIKSDEAKKYDTICIDSLSELSEIVLLNEKNKETKSGNKIDGRLAYMETTEKIQTIIRQFRDIQDKNIYFAAQENLIKDELSGINQYYPMMCATKLSLKVGYFLDEVFHMEIIKKDEKNIRALRTAPTFRYVAKDRSTELEELEKPDLTYIFNKIKKKNIETNESIETILTTTEEK